MTPGGPLDAVRDVIPFTAEVYLRLFARLNAAQWPLPLLTPLAALGLIALAWRGRRRTMLALTAAAWVWVALTFYGRLYSELTFVGRGFVGAFLLQAALLLGAAARGALAPSPPRGRIAGLGTALALYGAAGHPSISALLGGGWAGAPCFALAPAPTVLTTLGLMLMTSRPWELLLLGALPVLWSLPHGLVEAALGLPTAPLAAGFTALFLAAAAEKTRSRARSAYDTAREEAASQSPRPR
jgi:hypothetical protein